MLSDSHVSSRVIMIRLFSPSILALLDFLCRLSLCESPVVFLFPTFFALLPSLHLHIRQTLTAPPSQHNEIESSQIERSHFYSCQRIIEETDSCSPPGTRDGSDGEMGGFCRRGWSGAIFHIEFLFFPVSFFLVFLSSCAALKFFSPLSKCIQGCTSIYF